MVPFLGRYWGEIASLAVVLRHPLMWHYLRHPYDGTSSTAGTKEAAPFETVEVCGFVAWAAHAAAPGRH